MARINKLFKYASVFKALAQVESEDNKITEAKRIIEKITKAKRIIEAEVEGLYDKSLDEIEFLIEDGHNDMAKKALKYLKDKDLLDRLIEKREMPSRKELMDEIDESLHLDSELMKDFPEMFDEETDLETYASKFRKLAENVITSIDDPPKTRGRTESENLEYHLNRLLAEDVTPFAEDELEEVDLTTTKGLVDKANERNSDTSPVFNFKSLNVPKEPSKELDLPSIQSLVDKANKLIEDKKELKLPSLKALVDKANKVLEDKKFNFESIPNENDTYQHIPKENDWEYYSEVPEGDLETIKFESV